MFLSLTGYTQSKQDYVWLFGLDPSSSEEDEGFRFDFSGVSLEISESNNGVYFDNNNASVCNKDGELLFYTNGCSIINRFGEIMPKGDSLNYDQFIDLLWADCKYGYPGVQDIMILPDPATELGYYILHKTNVYVPNVNEFELRYSYVDMTLDSGFGDVIVKNQVYYDTTQTRPLYSYFTAVNHENGKDWWIIQPLTEDSLFITFLLDENGIHRMQNQNSHEYFTEFRTSASGTSKFSPDGSKYAMYSYYNNLHVYDFDRETGELSNHQEIIIHDDVIFSEIWFSSVEWSPNSRFIYLTSRNGLYQVDMWAENQQDGILLIDIYNGTEDPFPTTFYLMAQAPDCRIYVCPTSSTNSYHVINDPNELGVDCNFVQNGIKLPSGTGVASMPNFPRFRVDEEDKCDPTLVSVIDSSPVIETLSIYPNPTHNVISIDSDLEFDEIRILQLDGRIVMTEKFQQNIDVSLLERGMYVIQFIENGRVQSTKKFIKR